MAYHFLFLHFPWHAASLLMENISDEPCDQMVIFGHDLVRILSDVT